MGIPWHVGSKSMEELSAMGVDSFILHQRFPQKEPEHFMRNYLPIGWYSSNKEGIKRETLWADMKEANRQLILGKTRSGKTFLMRRIMDAAIESGFSACHLSDIKNEMISSAFPLQGKFRKFLHKNEKARGVKIVSHRPLFFHKILHEKLPEGNIWFQISFSDIVAEELSILLGFEKEKYKNQQNIILKYFDMSGTLRALFDNISYSNENDGTKKSVLSSLENLIKYGVIGEDYSSDWIKIMNDGGVPILNLENYYQQIPQLYYQIYIKVLMRKIVQARQTGKLKNSVIVLIDEASKIVPEGKENSGSKQILWDLDVSAYYGVFIIFATQTITDLPAKVVNQCKYVYFPQTMNQMDVIELEKKLVYSGWHPSWKEGISAWLKYTTPRDLDTGERAWIMISADKRKKLGFYPYAPLSFHMETKR